MSALEHALQLVSYKCRTINVIEQLREFREYAPDLSDAKSLYDRYMCRMDAGDCFRRSTELGDALARLSISSIRRTQRAPHSKQNDPAEPIPRTAYILRSLKHPDEVDFLRKVYGPNFYLIAAYTPRDLRVARLRTRIASSSHDSQTDQYRVDAEKLVSRDMDDRDNRYGQKVGSTFPKADCFINAQAGADIDGETKRFVELLFGNTFRTPTYHEFGMFHAQAAALRSSALGRQVGAAIMTPNRDVIAIGTNEVPKYGGGQYWEGDNNDTRDFHLGEDSSDTKKREALAELFHRLKENKWFTSEKSDGYSVEKMVEHALPVLKGTRLVNLTEFGRVVHAEMAALLDASRRGASVQNSTMYTTTFPCHNCARHIVAAGIREVIYIEPYPKTLAADFHPDSIAVDTPGPTTAQVHFRPFVGVAPRLYMQLFEMCLRKDAHGKVLKWKNIDANPRLALSANFYITTEVAEVSNLYEKTGRLGLTPC
ncbi:MAG: deoxycytidylate deaminase-related protein [Nitrospira sp.]|nr:MAG: deoxycytidylate deaminase-related protein [Nitrospira sp.]